MLRIFRNYSAASGRIRLFSTDPKVLLSNGKLLREKSFINGRWVTASNNAGSFDVINPANGKTIANVPKMSKEDADRACAVSMEAYSSWKQTTPASRSNILLKMATLMIENVDDLAKIITLEAGKPLAESKGEVLYAASFYRFFAEEARRSYGTIIPSNVKGRSELVFKLPVGPAALITPWNFPCAMITRKVGIR